MIPTKILAEVKLSIELKSGYAGRWETDSIRKRELVADAELDAAEKIKEYIEDSKEVSSVADVYVEKVYKTYCSQCKNEYEEMLIDDKKSCACCGAIRESIEK